MYIVVVNDGSIDGTKRIASQYVDLVVDLPRHDESWTEKPELAKVFNAGFEALEKMNIEFVLISARAEFENFMNAPKKQHEDFKTDIWIRIGRVLVRARNE